MCRDKELAVYIKKKSSVLILVAEWMKKLSSEELIFPLLCVSDACLVFCLQNNQTSEKPTSFFLLFVPITFCVVLAESHLGRIVLQKNF